MSGPKHKHPWDSTEGGRCTFLGAFGTYDLYVHRGGKHDAVYVRWGSGANDQEGAPTRGPVPKYVGRHYEAVVQAKRLAGL